VQIEGGPWVDLGDRDFVASGGEGRVYAKGSVAYKIYERPEAAPSAGQIAALKAVSDPWVVVPGARLLDGSGQAVGHTARYVQGCWPLIRVVSPAFKGRHRIGLTRLHSLLDSMASTLKGVHEQGITVVDLNPMNLLMSRDLSGVHWIDTASWQTAHQTATAILPAVRDPDAAAHGAGSDWYSFAVVAFWLLSGVHPFKGKHPSTAGLQHRMAARLWAYHPLVKLPPTAAPASCLGPWSGWLHAVLCEGLREGPPGPLATTAPARAGAVTHRSPGGRSISATVAGGAVELIAADGRAVPNYLRADDWVAWDGRMLIRTHDQLLEVGLHDFGATTLCRPIPLGTVLPHATTLYEGVAIQTLLGESWAVLYHEPGRTARVRLPAVAPLVLFSAEMEGHLRLRLMNTSTMTEELKTVMVST